MTANFKLMLIILLVPYTEAGIYNLFTPSSRFVGFVSETFSPIGMEMCVKVCAKRASCASLNFHRGRLECELSHSDATLNPGSMTSDSEYIYIERNQIPQKYFDACGASCSARKVCVSTTTGSKCVKSECSYSHPDANSTSVKVTSTSIGTTLSYTCKWNESITLTSTCKGGGTWTSSASSCPRTQYNPPDCFETNASCWYQFNFIHDTLWNGCPGGTRYVRKTHYSSAPYVGVVLCSVTRYKLYLGGNLTDTFLNIGDGSGQGSDLCELVGGLEQNANLPGDYPFAPPLTGYARNVWGQEFRIQSIAGGTSFWSNSWYECGVEIPGPTEPDCMTATPPCWYSYNVWVDNSISACSGGQILVKRTNYSSAPFLAVQLCNSTSYKLFLGPTLGSKFMTIFDGQGDGEDHCELVGGSELVARTSMIWTATSVYGYYRDHVGEQFSYMYVNYVPSYYECGVSIPGTDTVF